MRINPNTLGPAERIIFEALGNRRWTTKRYTKATVKQANAVWRAVREAVGFSTFDGWVTTESTNPKLGKSGLPTIGVTLHAATGAAVAWDSLESFERAALAVALGTTVNRINDMLKATLCPRSTKACRDGCVAAKSSNAKLDTTQRTRLARTLLTLVRPADALALTAHKLKRLGDKNGRDGARWRVNIADDIRWELLAPGLFKLGVTPYTYTKWSPAERPERLGMRIVYSATERHSAAELVNRCRSGHRVCIVFDLPKKASLPSTWNGIRVVNGDKTDDLWQHPAASIVGLRVKGTLAERASMRLAGFARKPVSSPVSSPVPQPVLLPLPVSQPVSQPAPQRVPVVLSFPTTTRRAAAA